MEFVLLAEPVTPDLAIGIPSRLAMNHAIQVTLWTLGMSGNAVECEARAHPLGVELRYLLNDRLLMSRVFDSWDRLSTQAQNWRVGLEGRGWSDRPAAFVSPH